MVNRYLPAGQEVEEVFQKVVVERFPGYVNIKFRLLMDTKKRMKQGKLTMASIELANEKIKYFSVDDQMPEGVDYIVITDSVAWEYANAEDRERLFSHELSHIFIDEKGKYKLIGHDFEDFISEIQRNEDNPEWSINLGQLVEDIYSQEKESKE